MQPRCGDGSPRIDRARSAAAASAHWSTPTTSVLPGSLCADEPRVCGLPSDAQVVHISTGAGSPVLPGADTQTGTPLADARVPRLRTFLRPSSEDATDRMERASPIRLRQLLADRAQFDLQAARIEESVLIAIVPLTMQARVRDLEAKYLGE
jgi:hypothetical protein